MKDLIIVRGGGDLATGVVQKFFRSGFPVLILETEKPTAIRTTVSLCEAVYTGRWSVEDMVCEKVESLEQTQRCWKNDIIPIIIDAGGEFIEKLKPAAVIDAIIAKKNLGTHKDMATATIALGPGFVAGKDVDVVIETMRGHDLGRLITAGSALENTGIPGEIGGQSTKRVIHAPISGRVKHLGKIGDSVKEGETMFFIEETPIKAPFTGILRGIIHEEIWVKEGMKIADVDPRISTDWRTISDKARCLGGAALEAYFYCKKRRG